MRRLAVILGVLLFLSCGEDEVEYVPEPKKNRQRWFEVPSLTDEERKLPLKNQIEVLVNKYSPEAYTFDIRVEKKELLAIDTISQKWEIEREISIRKYCLKNLDRIYNQYGDRYEQGFLEERRHEQQKVLDSLLVAERSYYDEPFGAYLVTMRYGIYFTEGGGRKTEVDSFIVTKGMELRHLTSSEDMVRFIFYHYDR